MIASLASSNRNRFCVTPRLLTTQDTWCVIEVNSYLLKSHLQWRLNVSTLSQLSVRENISFFPLCFIYRVCFYLSYLLFDGKRNNNDKDVGCYSRRKNHRIQCRLGTTQDIKSWLFWEKIKKGHHYVWVCDTSCKKREWMNEWKKVCKKKFPKVKEKYYNK